MRLIISAILSFICVNLLAQMPLNPFSTNQIDYTKRFSVQTRSQAIDVKKGDLQPMLDVGVLVPNGGMYRFIDKNQIWNGNISGKYVRIFNESDYQTSNPLYYYRFDWYRLEGQKDEYLFDEAVEPLLIDAYKKHARVILGLACNCGSSHVAQKINGKAVAVPQYLFDAIQSSENPMYEDDQYGEAYVPDYDSPLLLERHEALLSAFSKWLEGNVLGTGIKKKDVIFGIETRYFGYWGEGATRTQYYPKTDLFHKYLDSYNNYFPDILIIGSANHFVHLPSEVSYFKDPHYWRFELSMQHCSKMLTMENNFGPWGLFIDSWQYNSDRFDLCSKLVILDKEGKPVSLALQLRDKIYGKRYITGEFDFFGKDGDEPYGGLYQQFTTRGISGISANNVRVSIDGKRQSEISESVYTNIRECLSMVGYRIVLNPDVKLTKRWFHNHITFSLSNIGVSRMYQNYYKIRLFVKAKDGSIVYETYSDFDLRKLSPQPDCPLLFDRAKGVKISQNVGRKKGSLYIQIIDTKGIELPMTLSNYGRQADGSYFLGEIK